MDSKDKLAYVPVICGPNELALSTRTTGDGEASKWATSFVTDDSKGIIREVETPSAPDEIPVPPHRIVAITIDKCSPQEGNTSRSHIIGNAAEISADLGPDAEPRKLGRAAVLGYDPRTGKGVMLFSPDQAATKD